MLQGVAGAVLLFVHYAVLITTLYALVHAALQRPDAYTAVDKLTKPAWLVILAAAFMGSTRLIDNLAFDRHPLT